jgi:hypothetical protein
MPDDSATPLLPTLLSNALRAGHAFAEVVLARATPQRHWLRESRRAWLWGYPSIDCWCMFAWAGRALFLWLVYPLRVLRIARKAFARSAREIGCKALFLVLGKFPRCSAG